MESSYSKKLAGDSQQDSDFDDIEINPPNIFDGNRYSLYHSNDTSETAFIIPGLNTKPAAAVKSKAYSSRIGILWKEQSITGEGTVPSTELLTQLTKS